MATKILKICLYPILKKPLQRPRHNKVSQKVDSIIYRYIVLLYLDTIEGYKNADTMLKIGK